MALTKISRGLLNTGVSDSSDATFLTVDSSENATLAGNLTVSGNLTVTGTSTTVDTVTMNAQNAVIFEGSTADNYETTLSIVDPTADHTQYLINQGGYVPVLATVTTTAITSTPAELNLIDGGTARGTDALASGDGILINDAGTMKMTNVDTVKTFMGTTTEEIQDIAGAMFTSNTETGITATYQDGDGTIDLVVGTLNQNTSGSAALATLATSITASANNSTDETVYPTFVDGATGTQGLETDTGLTYNPSTGMLTSTGVTSTFTGNITGNVTGNTSGTAATVTTAAQTNITSLGTLTALAITGDLDIADTGAGAITVGGTTNTYNFPVVINATDAGLAISDGTKTIGIWGTHGGSSHAGSGIGTRSNHDMSILTNDTKRMVIQAAGNVGIGTTSPADKLHVVGDIRIDGGNQMTNEIAWFNSSHYLAGIRQASHSSYNDSGGLQFLTSGTSNAAESVKMVLDTQGNVGIGTTSPGSVLHLGGASNKSIAITSATSNKAFLSAWQDTAMFGINRDPATGTMTQTGRASALVRLESYDVNAFITFQTSATNNAEPTERMRIMSTGAVLIGQTAQTGYTFAEQLVVGGGTGVNNQGITIQSAQNSQGNLAFNRDNGTTAYGRISYQHGTNYMNFMTNNAERMRISSGGRQTYDGSSTATGHANFVGEVGASMKAVMFERTNGGGEVGSIVANASSTSYNTSSDYRLKENVDYTWDATTRLKQLKPARFNWISDDSNTLIEGFLAHEVSSIVPEAVSGVKDAIDEDGNPDHQGIDQSKLVPLMVKTIQEAMERIETLETSNLDLEEKLNMREGELEQRIHEIEQRLV